MIEYKNLAKELLIEEIIKRGEGCLNEHGAVEINTGKFQNLLPNHTFIVLDDKTESIIDWTQNNNILKLETDLFKEKIKGYLLDKEIFIQNVNVGSNCKLPIKLITTSPYYCLFIKAFYESLSLDFAQYNIYFLPEFEKDKPKIIYNLFDFNIYICGTGFSGEINTAINFILNNILLDLNVLPLKCMANCNETNDKSMLFIGVTELEKHAILNYRSKYIVGGEYHQWADNGLYSTESGIRLDISFYEKNDIKNTAINKFGSIIENDIEAVTELSNIQNYIKNGFITNPSDVVFFINHDGDLLHKLSKEQAFFFFLISAHTENHPNNLIKYANSFYNKLKRHEPNIWLINSNESDSVKNEINKIVNKTADVLQVSDKIIENYKYSIEPYFQYIKNSELLRVIGIE